MSFNSIDALGTLRGFLDDARQLKKKYPISSQSISLVLINAMGHPSYRQWPSPFHEQVFCFSEYSHGIELKQGVIYLPLSLWNRLGSVALVELCLELLYDFLGLENSKSSFLSFLSGSEPWSEVNNPFSPDKALNVLYRFEEEYSNG